MATDKRVFFRSRTLPWLLLAPQGVVIGVFFFWPAFQAMLQSLQQTDTFGGSVEWVGLDNFKALWHDPNYLASFQTTAVFSVLVAGLGIGISLLLAVFADRVVRGAADLQDAADLALRGRTRSGRRAVALHVLAEHRHRLVLAARDRA